MLSNPLKFSIQYKLFGYNKSLFVLFIIQHGWLILWRQIRHKKMFLVSSSGTALHCPYFSNMHAKFDLKLKNVVKLFLFVEILRFIFNLPVRCSFLKSYPHRIRVEDIYYLLIISLIFHQSIYFYLSWISSLAKDSRDFSMHSIWCPNCLSHLLLLEV